MWVSGTRTPSGVVLSLVDLRHASDDRWTSAHGRAPDNRGWRVAIGPIGADPGGGDAALAMSPWTRGGDAVRLPVPRDGWSRLPAFRRWIVIHRPIATDEAS